MKLLAYLISFFILALTANPCIDRLSDDGMQKQEQTQTSKSSKHQNEADHCSPFCACQCCQTSFYVSDFTYSIAVHPLDVRYSEIQPSFRNIELFDFFNPPRA